MFVRFIGLLIIALALFFNVFALGFIGLLLGFRLVMLLIFQKFGLVYFNFCSWVVWSISIIKSISRFFRQIYIELYLLYRLNILSTYSFLLNLVTPAQYFIYGNLFQFSRGVLSLEQLFFSYVSWIFFLGIIYFFYLIFLTRIFLISSARSYGRVYEDLVSEDFRYLKYFFCTRNPNINQTGSALYVLALPPLLSVAGKTSSSPALYWYQQVNNDAFLNELNAQIELLKELSADDNAGRSVVLRKFVLFSYCPYRSQAEGDFSFNQYAEVALQGQVPQGQVPQGQVPQGQVPQGQDPDAEIEERLRRQLLQGQDPDAEFEERLRRIGLFIRAVGSAYGNFIVFLIFLGI